VAGVMIEKRLPDATELRFRDDGVEAKLVQFIEGPSRRVDATTWFTFDRLEFDTDSDRLRPSSQEQLKNVAEILKAYPNVAIKIGGYTDNQGGTAHNQDLSTRRAAATRQALEGLGVGASRLESEGYGEQHPVADNGTSEGRQRNRRIDMRVTKK